MPIIEFVALMLLGLSVLFAAATSFLAFQGRSPIARNVVVTVSIGKVRIHVTHPESSSEALRALVEAEDVLRSQLYGQAPSVSPV
jgi:hypothetical protein